jgi:hypothetical protein
MRNSIYHNARLCSNILGSLYILPVLKHRFFCYCFFTLTVSFSNIFFSLLYAQNMVATRKRKPGFYYKKKKKE